MPPLRVALLGCGAIGARHAAAVGALRDDMRLVACCGREAAKTKTVAAGFGDGQVPPMAAPTA